MARGPTTGMVPMFKSKVVFVLGAGAGEDINMPVGSGLVHTIIGKMALNLDKAGTPVGRGDHRLFTEVAKRIGQDEALRAARRLWDGLPFVKSIDDFLDYNNQMKTL